MFNLIPFPHDGDINACSKELLSIQIVNEFAGNLDVLKIVKEIDQFEILGRLF